MDASPFFLQEKHSDVTFIVGPESGQTWRFPAHRFIMSVSSQVFERMFTGNFREKDSGTVRVTDTAPIAFKFMLQHIYEQDVHLDNVQIMYQVLQVAQKYLITSLVDKCISLLIPNLNIATFLPIFHLTHEIEEDRRTELLVVCLEFLDGNVGAIMKRNDFVLLDRSAIMEILDRDSLKETETEILKGVLYWAKHQCCKRKLEINQKNMRCILGAALYKIRFFNMNWEELDNVFTNLDILTPDERKSFIKHYLNQPYILTPPWDIEEISRPRNQVNHLQYRLWEVVDENIQTKKEDSLYVVFTCDIVLKTVFFSVRVDESKLVLLQGSISDLHGLVIQDWKFKKTFDEDYVDSPQSIQVEVPTSLNAFKCYKVHVLCFSGNLCPGGTDTLMVGTYSVPKQIILHCKSGLEVVVEDSWKSSEYWKRFFEEYEWQSAQEPSNLSSAFELIQFFIVKRNKEGFVQQI